MTGISIEVYKNCRRLSNIIPMMGLLQRVSHFPVSASTFLYDLRSEAIEAEIPNCFPKVRQEKARKLRNRLG